MHDAKRKLVPSGKFPRCSLMHSSIIPLEQIDGRNEFTFIWRSSPHSYVIGGSKRWSLTRCYTVENYGEVFPPPLKLLIIVNEVLTINVPHRTVERFGATVKFFREATYGSGINIA